MLVRTGFLNRGKELSELDALLHRQRSELLIVFGRRRIGKTTLLSHWLDHADGVRGVYWVAHRSTSGLLLRSFSRALAEAMPGDRAEFSFTSWEAAFEQLFRLGAELPANQRLVIILDEFPYLVQSAPEVPSLLQKIWDQRAASSRALLVLCGSQYQMMQDQLLSPRQPLYGRSTASMLVEEVAPAEIELFLPRYSPTQVVETYSVVGGVPKYLELWDDGVPVLRNIRDKILSPVSIFRHEALFLIQDELAQPRTYLGILEALGAGLRTPAELGRRTGLAINHIGKYLQTLVDLRLVRRVLSEDVENRAQSRLSRYEIRDPFLRFHFQFVRRHPELVEQGRWERLASIIEQGFDSFVGGGYEELARRHVTSLGDSDQLPFRPEFVGRAWNRDVELDLVALDRGSRSALVGECKWRSTALGPDALDALLQRAARLPRLSRYHKRYALFSRAGFTAPLIERAERDDVMLFEGADFRLL